MSYQEITLTMDPEFAGTLVNRAGHEVAVGTREGGVMPYDMLLGALGSCFYSTFLDVVVKKKLTFEHVTMTIDGDKRETIPMTLERVAIKMVVSGGDPAKEKAFSKAMDLSAKYCSVYQTLTHVAQMSYSIEVEG